MKVRFLILLTLLSAILVLIGKLVISAHATNQPAQENAQRKIAPWVMEHTENGAEAEFLVILGDKADLSGMQRRVAATRFHQRAPVTRAVAELAARRTCAWSCHGTAARPGPRPSLRQRSRRVS